MTKKRVLDIGNCAMDHGAIRALIEREFDAELVQCHDQQSALKQLKQTSVDLVLINRKLDRDGSDGLAILKQLTSEHGPALPVMLITNYEEYQQIAEDHGAVPGFGKAELTSATTRERLAKHLE